MTDVSIVRAYARTVRSFQWHFLTATWWWSSPCAVDTSSLSANHRRVCKGGWGVNEFSFCYFCLFVLQSIANKNSPFISKDSKCQLLNLHTRNRWKTLLGIEGFTKRLQTGGSVHSFYQWFLYIFFTCALASTLDDKAEVLVVFGRLPLCCLSLLITRSPR